MKRPIIKQIAISTLLCLGTEALWGADLELTLQHAIQLALSDEGNARVQLAREWIEQAQAQSAQARARLLPSLDGTVRQQSQTLNLEALGLKPQGLFRPPTLVGPFSTFDARASLTQALFDSRHIRRFQASRKNLGAAQLERESVLDRTAAETARAYLAALRARSRVKAATAGRDLAGALVELAESQKEAGTGTRIEVTRAGVKLAEEEQRVLAAQLEYDQAILKLLQVIGLSLELTVDLSQQLEQIPRPSLSPQEILSVALQSRPDLRAQELRVQRARLDHGAARAERYPWLAGYADYGTIGSAISNTIPTWTLGVSLQIPVFEGGALRAQRSERKSILRQEETKLSDLRKRIELDVRLAAKALEITEARIGAAVEGLELAGEEVAQARRRYQAGVVTSLEITDAQTRLRLAEENHIASLYDYNLARVSLAESMGTARTLMLP